MTAPADVRHRTVTREGIRLHVAEAGEEDAPLVVLVHGMPELWYSWRRQLGALAAAGYRAAALDLRGMGGSDAPRDLAGYGMRHLVGDVIGVMDASGAARAALVGHDWGANVVWDTAARHPERVGALFVLSIPYHRRPPSPPAAIGENTARFFEQALAQPALAQPALAEAPDDPGHAALRDAFYRLVYAFSGDAPADVVPALFRGPQVPNAAALRDVRPPATPPDWLTADDLDVYVRAYARTGFDGVLARYRSMTRDWEESADIADAVVPAPTLFVTGDREPAVMYGSLEPMKAAVPNLRDVVVIPGAGHWLHQERAAEVNALLVEFLAREFPARRFPARPAA